MGMKKTLVSIVLAGAMAINGITNKAKAETEPTPILYEYYNEGDENDFSGVETTWLAQTFTVGNVGLNENFDISKIKVKLARRGSPGTCYVRIRETSDNRPTGLDLSLGDFDGNRVKIDSSGDWNDAIDMSPYTLQASTQYALIINCPESNGAANSIRWRRDDSNPTYTGGIYVVSYDGGINWDHLYPTIDMMFEVYGEATGGLPPNISTIGKERYSEDFSKTNCINRWIISDTNSFYRTEFEGDEVLRFNNESNSNCYAYIPIKHKKSNSFKLEWDSYIEDSNQSILASYFNFGLFSDIKLDGDNNYYIESGLAQLVSDSNEVVFNVKASFSNNTDSLIIDKETSASFLNKWMHNILLYNYPCDDARVSGLIIYQGKGNIEEVYSNNTRALPSKLVVGGGYIDLIKMGFPESDYVNNNSRGYVDNIKYSEIKKIHTLKGDLNKDGIVNFEDFTTFANQWLKQEKWYQDK